MNAYYQLDEKHQLYPVPKEYEIESPHPIAFINQNKTLKLYHECDRQFLNYFGTNCFYADKK